ncbi:MAG: hypothetical protein AB1726_15640 [Planctomycetota bacterium]
MARLTVPIVLVVSVTFFGLAPARAALAVSNPCPDLVYHTDLGWQVNCPNVLSCGDPPNSWACDIRSGSTGGGNFIIYCGCNDNDFGCCRAGLELVGLAWIPAAIGKCSSQDPSCPPGNTCQLDDSIPFQRKGRCVLNPIPRG